VVGRLFVYFELTYEHYVTEPVNLYNKVEFCDLPIRGAVKYQREHTDGWMHNTASYDLGTAQIFN